MTDRDAIEVLKGMYKTVSMCLTSKDCEEHNLAITKAIIALNFKIASETEKKHD